MARLVATDLDGTLLRSDGTVSPRTAAAVAEVRGAGVEVVLATGRPIRYVGRVAAELGITAPVVCANGAVLYDAVGDVVVGTRLLDLDVSRRVVDLLRERFPGVAFGAETARGFTCEPAFAVGTDIRVPGDAVRHDGSWLDGERLAKLLLRHPHATFHEVLPELVQAVDGVASITHSGPSLLEIAAAGVTKAAGLAQLVEERGLTSRDVVAFGDMPNDVAMLAWAGRSVAVANAHPEVLAVVQEVTGSNDDDGVAAVLEELAR